MEDRAWVWKVGTGMGMPGMGMNRRMSMGGDVPFPQRQTSEVVVIFVLTKIAQRSPEAHLSKRREGPECSIIREGRRWRRRAPLQRTQHRSQSVDGRRFDGHKLRQALRYWRCHAGVVRVCIYRGLTRDWDHLDYVHAHARCRCGSISRRTSLPLRPHRCHRRSDDRACSSTSLQSCVYQFRGLNPRSMQRRNKRACREAGEVEVKARLLRHNVPLHHLNILRDKPRLNFHLRQDQGSFASSSLTMQRSGRQKRKASLCPAPRPR